MRTAVFYLPMLENQNKPERSKVRIDRDFLRGNMLIAAKRQGGKRGRLLKRLAKRSGALDVLAWQVNNDIGTDDEDGGELTPMPDTGRPVSDFLTWFIENIDVIIAAIQKILALFDGMLMAVAD